MNQGMELMRRTAICPIMTDIEESSVIPAARALADGGLPLVEKLIREERSYSDISRIAAELPEMFVGAGSIFNLKMAEKAIEHGAKFIVMPGFNRQVVEMCVREKIPVLPGCVTPTELMMALEFDLEVVKFYPVYEMGGIAKLAQFTDGPFGRMNFVLTGGLTETNFQPLISYKHTYAVGGEWMFRRGNALKERNFGLIRQNIEESIRRVREIRGSGC